LAVMGEVHLAAGRAKEALEAATEAVRALERARTVEIGECLIRVVHAESLHAVGDVEAAREAIRTTESWLRARAGRIRDAEVRASYLERVQENVKTLKLAREWLR